MKDTLTNYFYRHKDTFERAGKTAVQSFLGVIIGSNVLGQIQDTSVIDANALQRVIISAGAAAVSGLISFVWNLLLEGQRA